MTARVALWVLTFVPTPQCMEADRAKHVIIVRDNRYDPPRALEVRTGGEAPRTRVELKVTEGGREPELAWDPCYDVLAGRLEARQVKLAPPKAAPAASAPIPRR